MIINLGIGHRMGIKFCIIIFGPANVGCVKFGLVTFIARRAVGVMKLL